MRINDISLGSEVRKEQWKVGFFGVLQMALGASIPILFRNIVDGTIEGKTITPWVVAIIGVVVLNVIVNYVDKYRWQALRVKGIQILRSKMLKNYLAKEFNFYGCFPVGEVVAKILDDIKIPAQTMTIGIPMLFLNVMNLLITIGILTYLSPRLALIALISMPIYYFAFTIFNRKLRGATEQERITYSQVVQDVEEIATGVRTVRVYCAEEHMHQKFDRTLHHYFEKTKDYIRASSLASSSTQFVASMVPIVTLVFGIGLVYRNLITIGTVVGFYTYLGQLFEPIRNLSDFNIGYQQSVATLSRIKDLIHTDKLEFVDTVDPIDSIETIRLDNVGFKYSSESDFALRNISLTIKKGQRLGIVGASGCGKSTLLNVILGFYPTTTGVVLYNEHPIASLNRENLLKLMGLADQYNFLFRGTVEENIKFGRDIPKSSLDQAVEIAQIGSFIDSMPDGFQTIVDSHSLSSGQKQRLCLARAIVKTPDLLLLDEATSALDSETERMIVEYLDTWLEEKILIAVSHRPKILEICDTIVFMQRGQIAAVGSYTDLSQQSAEFRQLVQEEDEKQEASATLESEIEVKKTIFAD